MTKKEFLNILKKELENNLSNDELLYQLKYYEKYIDDEIKSGKTEEQVLSELGEPNLIVKTILQVNKNKKLNTYSNSYENYYENYSNDKSKKTNNNIFYFSTNNKIECILFILILLIILISIFRFLGFAIFGLFYGRSIFSVLFIAFILYLFIMRRRY